MSEQNTKEPLHAGAVEIGKAVAHYFPETDPLVLQRITEWQELKFGLLMHWAPSSQWGIVESWSLCAEDEDWCRRSIEDYSEYKKQYEALKTTFNPVRFDPARWAAAAQHAGMKYVVFTTKHHDGFCMFDTQRTDYKVTDPGCPFHSHPQADITKAVFDAFRAKDFRVGTYFSKPDWHSDDFWWKRFATPDRNANYSIKKYPERWQRFVDFTHGQIDELMSNYGRIDILWLDGCWVRKYTDEQLEAEKKASNGNIVRFQDQDIDMPGITAKARKKQPGLIVVDRAVPGPQQNYLTPENQVPATVLPYPWETCMPMTPSWSYEPGLSYKSSRTLIHTLVDVVAKGGNFLLNVAPTAEGDFEPEAYERLKEIGAWIAVNGEAIYGSRPVAPYKEENICFTHGKHGEIYAIVLVPEGERMTSSHLRFRSFIPRTGATAEILGTRFRVPFTPSEEGWGIEIPAALAEQLSATFAWTLKIA